MEIGESPKDQVKKSDGKLHDSKHCYSMLHPPLSIIVLVTISRNPPCQLSPLEADRESTENPQLLAEG